MRGLGTKDKTCFDQNMQKLDAARRPAEAVSQSISPAALDFCEFGCVHCSFDKLIVPADVCKI